MTPDELTRLRRFWTRLSHAISAAIIGAICGVQLASLFTNEAIWLLTGLVTVGAVGAVITYNRANVQLA